MAAWSGTLPLRHVNCRQPLRLNLARRDELITLISNDRRGRSPVEGSGHVCNFRPILSLPPPGRRRSALAGRLSLCLTRLYVSVCLIRLYVAARPVPRRVRAKVRDWWPPGVPGLAMGSD
jgi:hypothetical protein